MFYKYNYLLSLLTKHQLFRDYLGLKEPVNLLVPNGYHIQRGDKIEATFFTSPIYYKKLGKALFMLDICHQYLTSIDQASRLLLEELGLLPSNIRLKMPHFVTTTFNPNASPESTSTDGRASRNVGGENFQQTHDGAGTASQHATANEFGAYIINGNTTNCNIYRGFFLFDTSSIGSSATITGGGNLFKLYVTAVVDTAGTAQTLQLITTTPGSNTTIANADYAQVGTTLQATGIAYASLTTSAYNTWTLNATGDGNISQTSITKFGIRGSSDNSNTAPSGAGEASVTVNFADNVTNIPQLIVIYTTPAILTTHSKFWGA